MAGPDLGCADGRGDSLRFLTAILSNSRAPILVPTLPIDPLLPGLVYS